MTAPTAIPPNPVRRAMLGMAGAAVLSGLSMGARAQSGKPIRIGASLSLTGTLAQSGDKVKRGYELWAEDVNSRAGLLGRPVQLLIFDDRSDAGTSARLYEKLITQDQVDLLIGPYGSAASFAASAVTEKYRIPMLLPSAASDAIFSRGYKHIFQMFPPIDTLFRALFSEIGTQFGYQRIAIINSSELYGKSAAKVFEKHAAENGRQIVLREEFPQDVRDLSSLMLKLKNAKADLLVGGTQLGDSISVIRQLRDSGVLPKAIALTPGPNKDDFWKALQQDAQGVMTDFLWEPVDPKPESQAFASKWRAAYRDDPDAQAAFGWAGGTLLEAAVTAAGRLDNDAIRKAFIALDQPTLLPGRFQVDPQTGRQKGLSTGIAQWQQGRRQIVSPAATATASMIGKLAPWDKRA